MPYDDVRFAHSYAPDRTAASIQALTIDPGGSTVSEFRGRVRNELGGSRSKGSYVDGERHGVWTYFDENGREPGTITFDNGRRVGG